MATAPKPNPTPTLPLPPVDDTADVFASAFADLTAEDNAPKINEGADPIVEGAAALEAAKPEGEPVKIEIEGVLPDPTKVGADGKVAGAPAAAEPEPKKDGQLSDEELMERFRSIIADPPKPTAAAPAAPAVPEPAAKPAVAEYNAEQKKIVDDYMAEWPDVYAAEQLIRAREYQALVNHIFTQLAPILQGLQATTGDIAVQSHMQKLEAAVPDYAEVAPKVMAWVGQQPAYLKKAFEHVTQNGSIDDVVDLIGRYRASVGETAPQLAAPAPSRPTLVPPAPVPAVSKAIKGLAPVATKRTGVQTDGINMDDFGGAFEAFARAI